MTFDVDSLQLALWLLPLPLLLFEVGSTGLRTRWTWGQVGALSVLAVVQFLAQATHDGSAQGWFFHRVNLWIAMMLIVLAITQSEAIAHALDRELGRKRRIGAATASFAFLAVASLLPSSQHTTPLVVGASLCLAFHEFFACMLPGPLWQRVLRGLIVGFFALTFFVPSMILPLSAAAVLSVSFDTIWLLRSENLQRLARAREALKPQALKELLSSTSSTNHSDEESIPIERLQALLSFAVQSTSSAGGVIFLYTETPTSVGTISRKLSCAAAQGSLARLAQAQDHALSAQILLSRMSSELVQAVQLDPDSRGDAFVLHTWNVPSAAAVPIRTRGRTLGLLAIAGQANIPRFGPQDRQLLEFLGMQAAFSLHYDTVYHQLQEESRLGREFEIAAGIQRGLLPKTMPSTLNLDLAALLLPAREVGGDYVDLLPLSDDRLLAAIGDVSGKGLGPGMIMLIVRTILHVLVDLQPNTPPAGLVRSLEEKLVPQLGALTFMTFLLLRWNGRDRTLTWCGAGHENIILLSSAGDLQKIRTGGIALGLARDKLPNRDEKRMQLTAGDTLLFYTDGVTECRNPAGEGWGTLPMEESLRRHAHKNASEVLKGVVDDLEAFRDGALAHDDRTLLVFKVQ